MAKYEEFGIDSEAQSIAMKLQEKYEGLFKDHDLEKVGFLRLRGKKSSEPAKTIGTGFPYDVYNPDKIYFVFIYESLWSELSDNQRVVVVFQQLMAMYPDGFDPDTSNYAKIRKRDVSEYSEVLSAVQLRYDWKEVGVDVPNLLEMDLDVENPHNDVNEEKSSEDVDDKSEISNE